MSVCNIGPWASCSILGRSKKKSPNKVLKIDSNRFEISFWVYLSCKGRLRIRPYSNFLGSNINLRLRYSYILNFPCRALKIWSSTIFCESKPPAWKIDATALHIYKGKLGISGKSKIKMFEKLFIQVSVCWSFYSCSNFLD